MRDIRVSPDGESVAIRSDKDADGIEAYGVFNAVGGGFWIGAAYVEDWTVLGS